MAARPVEASDDRSERWCGLDEEAEGHSDGRTFDSGTRWGGGGGGDRGSSGRAERRCGLHGEAEERSNSGTFDSGVRTRWGRRRGGGAEGRSDNGTFDSRLDGEAEALASRTGSDT